MAGLVKELLKDIYKLPIDIRCDLELTIKILYKSGVLSTFELIYLSDYIIGYNADEIALEYSKTTEEIETVLTRICKSIEERSCYLDQEVIHRAESSKKYPKYKIPLLKEFLENHGKNFNDNIIVEPENIEDTNV